ncbi:hypothetical protein [Enterococcus sp. HY326]|uniref:hypothetical protein n=1 Tax=Enterococcus sp. HY326 TaxID=2971265 RepID=UPI002240BDCF|nr:hypothetical protein [Enterococcus sp. HY326]
MHKQNLIEIYTTLSPDESFNLGKKILELPDFIVFEMVSEYGTLDSIAALRKSLITETVSESRYLNYFNFVTRLNQKNGVYDPYLLKSSVDNLVKYDNVYDFALQEKLVVTILTDTTDTSFIGRLIEHSKSQLTLQPMDYSLEKDAPITIAEKDVSVIDILSMENFFLSQYWHYQEEIS